MAEDIILNAGAGGATLATDEASSLTAGLAKYQLTKIAFGAKGTRTLVENSAGATFPVNIVGAVNNISATVNAVLGAGAANIGLVNSISATVNVSIAAQSATLNVAASLVAGTTINNISATVNAVLGAGAANIGSVNNISATVNVSIAAQSATLNVAASLVAGTTINNISATVGVSILGQSATLAVAASLVAGSILNSISATVGVFIHGQSATLNVAASLVAGTVINNISATVNAVLGAGAANIGFINNISATVQVAIASQSATLNVNVAAWSATANVIARGDIAHDSPDSGNPLKIGGIASNVERTAVAALDRVDAWFDLVGRLVTAPWHADELSGTSTTLSATVQTAIQAAPAAGLSLYICSVLATNKSATQVRVKLRESPTSTGVLKVQGDCASSGGGFFWKPMRPWKLPSATALGGAVSPAASDVAITVEFFTAA